MKREAPLSEWGSLCYESCHIFNDGAGERGINFLLYTVHVLWIFFLWFNSHWNHYKFSKDFPLFTDVIDILQTPTMSQVLRFGRVQTCVSHSLYLRGLQSNVGDTETDTTQQDTTYKRFPCFLGTQRKWSKKSFPLLLSPQGNKENLKATCVRREKQTASKRTGQDIIKSDHENISSHLRYQQWFLLFYFSLFLCAWLWGEWFATFTAWNPTVLKKCILKYESAKLW